MASKTIKVPNVGCNGCVNTIKAELEDITGVNSVSGVVDTQMITVEYGDPASWEAIVATLKEINYAPESA